MDKTILDGTKPKKGNTSSTILENIDEAEWIHEAVRIKIPELVEHISIDSITVGRLCTSNILTAEEFEQFKDTTPPSKLFEVLLGKEDPYIWSSVFEILQKDNKSINVTFVETIKKFCSELKKNPKQVSQFIEERSIPTQIQNSAKLASLILEKGTSILAKYFTEHMRNKFGTLDNAYNSDSIKHTLEQHKQISDSSRELISSTQYHAIVESKFETRHIQNFDLALILNLIDTTMLQGNSDTTNLTEHNRTLLHNKFKVIKTLRTNIFLQLCCGGVNNLKFSAQWGELISALYFFSLKSSTKRNLHKFIDKCLTKTYSKPEVQQLKTTIMLCQEQDQLDTKHLIEKFQLSTQLIARKQFAGMSVIVENLRDVLRNYQQCNPKERELLFECIQNVHDKTQETLKTVCQSVGTVSEQLNSLSQQTKQGISQISERLYQNSQECHSLSEISEAFSAKMESFKILIINQPGREEIKTLSETLGNCPWNFIIDLDYESRTTGIHNQMSKTLRKHKHFHVILYNEVQNIQERVKKSIADGEQAVWFLANGCAEIGCKRTEDSFGKALEPLMSLLESILREASFINPVIATVCVLSKTCLRPMNRIVGRLEDIFENLDDFINHNGSCLITIEENFEASIQDVETKMKKIKVKASTLQIAATFQQLFGALRKDDIFYYPGDKGPCMITRSDLTRLDTMMTLYHQDIGKVVFGDDVTKQNAKIWGLRVLYLKGGDISAEVFFLHKQYGRPFYALRKEMERGKAMIEKELKKRETEQHMRYSRFPFTIHHDPSGGGSTVLGYILYELKEQYPCILLKYADVSVIEPLKKISKYSKKHLIIGIDNPEIPAHTVLSLNNNLSNEFVACLIVHTQVLLPIPVDDESRVKGKRDISKVKEIQGKECACEPKHCINIHAILSDKEDKSKFQMLYHEFKEDVTASKVYLFGLSAFCEHYERLDEVVRRCIQHATIGQQKLLRMVCCLDRYADFHIKVKLLVFLLQGKNTNTYVEMESDIMQILGSVGDLLIYNSANHTLRLIHNCVITPMYRHLGKELSLKEIITLHINDIAELAAIDSAEKKMSSYLCTKLFLQKNNEITEFYSPFVTTMFQAYSDELPVVAEHFKTIINALDGSHVQNTLRAMYARFLLLKLDNISESTKEAKTALGITPNTASLQLAQPTKHIGLLTAYGNLYRHVAYKRLKNHLDNKGSFEQAFPSLLDDVKESVYAFKCAQKLFRAHSNYRVTPLLFIGEAVVCNVLLESVFKHICKKNHERFHKYINTARDNFLKECEQNALDALDNVIHYRLLDRLLDQDPQETSRKILDIKFKLLRLRYDASSTCQKILTKLDDGAPLDVGILVRAGNSQCSQNVDSIRIVSWEDLSTSKLELIIKYVDSKIATGKLLSSNYDDIIKAMIYLRQADISRKKFGKYNIDYALYCAEIWKEWFPDYFNAHFVHAVISLAKGTQNPPETNCIRNFKASFNKCKDMLRKNPSSTLKTRYRFHIGCGVGVARLLPYKRDTGIGKLHSFSGRLITKREVIIAPFGGELTALLDYHYKHKDFPTEQKPSVTFNLTVGNNALIATNVELADNDT